MAQAADLFAVQPRFATELIPTQGTTQSWQPSISLCIWAREVFLDG